jgi:hypothetical protein
MKTLITTTNFWNNFTLEYDRGDMDWAFDRIKSTSKGNKTTLQLDDTFICTHQNWTGQTPYSWFIGIMKYDIDPCGWVMDTYEEGDRAEKAKKRAYIKGCKNILKQI